MNKIDSLYDFQESYNASIFTSTLASNKKPKFYAYGHEHTMQPDVSDLKSLMDLLENRTILKFNEITNSNSAHEIVMRVVDTVNVTKDSVSLVNLSENFIKRLETVLDYNSITGIYVEQFTDVITNNIQIEIAIKLAKKYHSSKTTYEKFDIEEDNYNYLKKIIEATNLSY